MPAEPSRYTLRDARPDDASGIAHVNSGAWRAAYVGLIPQQALDEMTPESLVVAWQQLLDSNNAPVRRDRWSLLVARDGETHVGYTFFGPSRDSDADASRVAELYGLYVLPEYWGEGVAPPLIEMVIGRSRGWGFEQLTLWVLPENIRARAFYERHGWALDGAEKLERIDDVQIPHVRMRRALTPSI